MLNEETKKLLADKRWRMEHLYKIVDKERHLVLFKFNEEQETLFNKYIKKKQAKELLREFQLKNRQIGMTTFHCIWYLDDAIWENNRNNGIIAHEKDALEKIFLIVKVAWLNMPDWCRPQAERENKRELYFPSTNSTIFITLKARSGTLSGLHISEYAKIKDIVELKAGSFQAAGNGDITCEFTGNGLNHAYSEWNSEFILFTKHFFSWLEHKEYRTKKEWPSKRECEAYLDEVGADEEQRNWWYFKKEELTVGVGGKGNATYLDSFSLIKQEYPSTPEDAFVSSSQSIFKEEIKQYPILEPIRTERDGGIVIDIYEEPKEGEAYTIGADPSGGFPDGDRSSMYILNTKTRDICVRLHGCIAPDLFGVKLVEWAIKYNKAFIVPEVNNHGTTTINAMKDDYSEIYRRERRDRVTNEVTKELGWNTNNKTRDEMIDELKRVLREKEIPAIPQSLYSELMTFVKKDDGRIEAENGCYDDEVFGVGLAIMGIKSNPFWEVPKKDVFYMGRKVIIKPWETNT